jgi:hypothetical protein
MAGDLLRISDVVTCTHKAPTKPPVTPGRVCASGQPVVTTLAPYVVLGCPATTRCATGAWTIGATRVQTMGQALALDTGSSVCVASGTPLQVDDTSVQKRVKAS